MSILRQVALAAVLVAGTAIAVIAYLDTQHGNLPSASQGRGPILEFGPSYPMARPLRVPSRQGLSQARLRRMDRTEQSTTQAGRPAAATATVGSARPVPAAFGWEKVIARQPEPATSTAIKIPGLDT